MKSEHTYESLVKAGAPELPHGWAYEIHASYGYPKVSIWAPRRFWFAKRVATEHILDRYGRNPLDAAVEGCKGAVSKVEFFAEVNKGVYAHTCSCKGDH
jgi:hypothetical protein